MSAFICNNSHVTALAVYADRARILGGGDALRIGAMLHAENVASVNHRYGESTRPRFRACEWAASHPFTPVEIVKAARCLIYQSCEHPGWESGAACRLLEAIVASIAGDTDPHALPGYDAAAWEIARPAPAAAA